jgi:hypothetical protein
MTGKSVMYGLSRIYWLAQTLAERPQMTDMVQMIMRNQHSRKGIRRKIIFLERLLETTKTHACIDQNATILSSKIIAVATASA